MRIELAIAALTTCSCAGGTHWHRDVPVRDWEETPARPPRADDPVTATVFSLRDAEPDEPKEFPELAGECGSSVTASIEGSFTEAEKDQVMYSVDLFPCDGSVRGGKSLLVVYEGDSEVARMEGGRAVRAIDVDGDGQDEWTETALSCVPETGVCTTSFRTRNAEGRVFAEESKAVVNLCPAGGKIRWKSVTLRTRYGQSERAETRHYSDCP